MAERKIVELFPDGKTWLNASSVSKLKGNSFRWNSWGIPQREEKKDNQLMSTNDIFGDNPSSNSSSTRPLLGPAAYPRNLLFQVNFEAKEEEKGIRYTITLENDQNKWLEEPLTIWIPGEEQELDFANAIYDVITNYDGDSKKSLNFRMHMEKVVKRFSKELYQQLTLIIPDTCMSGKGHLISAGETIGVFDKLFFDPRELKILDYIGYAANAKALNRPAIEFISDYDPNKMILIQGIKKTFNHKLTQEDIGEFSVDFTTLRFMTIWNEELTDLMDDSKRIKDNPAYGTGSLGGFETLDKIGVEKYREQCYQLIPKQERKRKTRAAIPFF